MLTGLKGYYYKGEFVKGKKQGQGEQRTQSGLLFIGEFKEDEVVG